MRSLLVVVASAAVLMVSSFSTAAEISGEYLEARTCDVYTGPCFANAEMNQSGKNALMAWKVDKGSWKGVSLDGLKVALILNAQGTLGFDGVFPMQAGKIKSVILVDETASKQQREALVAFVKDTAKDLTKHVVKIESVSMKLENNHLDGKGFFQAGKLAKIETRALNKDDCICTNEFVYYQPLTKVDNFSPAYSKTMSFQGKWLNNRWTTKNIRSAFLATFRK